MTHRVSVLVGVNQTAVFDKSDSHTYLKRLYIDFDWNRRALFYHVDEA